jgi:hypothetical protein
MARDIEKEKRELIEIIFAAICLHTTEEQRNKISEEINKGIELWQEERKKNEG